MPSRPQEDFEAHRKGVFDTRDAVSPAKALAGNERSTDLVAEIETWLFAVSVNDDLDSVRRQTADYIIALSAPAG